MAVGGGLGEGFQTPSVLIPVAADATDILDSSFPVAVLTLAVSPESLLVSRSVFQLGTSYSFLALG